MSRTKVRDGSPTDTIGMPSEQFPLAKRPKKKPEPEYVEAQLDEVSVSEIRVGDMVRARLYEGLRGRWFAAQCRQGQDLHIVRIEDAMMPSNGYYRAYPIRVAMTSGGTIFTLISSDDCYVHANIRGHAEFEMTQSALATVRASCLSLPQPAPRALRATNEPSVADYVYEEP